MTPKEQTEAVVLTERKSAYVYDDENGEDGSPAVKGESVPKPTLNQRYDRLPEPRRFLTFILPASVVAVPAWYGIQHPAAFGGHGTAVGAAGAFVMYSIALWRVLYLSRG